MVSISNRGSSSLTFFDSCDDCKIQYILLWDTTSTEVSLVSQIGQYPLYDQKQVP